MTKIIRIAFLLIFFISSFVTLCGEGVYVRNEESKQLYLKQIESAQKYVMIGAFKLHAGLLPDPQILKSIKQAALNLSSSKDSSNHSVKVYLESRLTPEEIRNYESLPPGSSLHAFQQTGAEILKDIQHYKNIHFKIVLTEKTAIIGTTNFDGEKPGFITRDFCVFIRNPIILNELKTTLEKVEQGSPIEWPLYKVIDLRSEEIRLTWGPQQHREHLIQLIQVAKSIDIYQQDLQDPFIFEALKKWLKDHKKDKGFKLRILMSEYPFEDATPIEGKKRENKSLQHLKALVNEGSQVRLTGRKQVINDLPLHIHAKTMLITLNEENSNNRILYLGSANFYGPVLDPEGKNLNVGIVTRISHFIDAVQKTFEVDWALHEGEDLTPST